MLRRPHFLEFKGVIEMKKKKDILDLMDQTRPRDVRPRSTVFEDRTKYKRSREKERLRKDIEN